MQCPFKSSPVAEECKCTVTCALYISGCDGGKCAITRIAESLSASAVAQLPKSTAKPIR